MICKNCGKVLPNNAYICTSCNTLMDRDQIKVVSNYNKEKSINKPEYISSEFGSKREFRMQDNKQNSHLPYIFILLSILFVVIYIIFIFL